MGINVSMTNRHDFSRKIYRMGINIDNYLERRIHRIQSRFFRKMFDEKPLTAEEEDEYWNTVIVPTAADYIRRRRPDIIRGLLKRLRKWQYMIDNYNTFFPDDPQEDVANRLRFLRPYGITPEELGY